MAQERRDWFEIWKGDKESILDTTVRNMASDLANGYNYYGKAITRQKVAIDEYKLEFDRQMRCLGLMDEKKVNWWCYMDLKRRGAIS